MAASPEEEGVMRRLAMVSTYPPRRCGLATFTDDPRRALATSAPQWIVEICAVDRDGLPYGPEVAEVIRQDRAEDYRRAGRALAASAVDLVVIQHEYGIFGGTDGTYVLGLAEELDRYRVLARPGRGRVRWPPPRRR